MALKLATFDLNAIGAKPRSATLAAKALKLASSEAEFSPEEQALIGYVGR
ncbi:MAG: hypothetical protein M0P91_12395 [Sulfuricurvum sp.]|jgi:hypothetical protein|nr:hypothetical protein [Sulfuricurvum sp.]MCK9373985.1 hypothetical protein [Sulfuricurvum sp.]